MIDNFNQISGLLKFDNENEFYFLQIIQRKKDHKEGQILGSDNSSRLIRAYYIYSVEQLNKYSTRWRKQHSHDAWHALHILMLESAHGLPQIHAFPRY